MNHISIIAITVAISFACTVTARSEGVEDVIARAKKLDQAGEPSEATAVLARAFAQNPHPGLISQWLDVDERRVTAFESKQTHKAIPELPQLDVLELARIPEVEAVAAAVVGGQPASSSVETVFDSDTVKLLSAALRGAGVAPSLSKTIREELDKHKPDLVDEREVNDRLGQFEECGKSVAACSLVVSRALQSAPSGEIDSLLPLKDRTRSLMRRVRKSRADFISYDYIAPRLIAAGINLIPDASGLVGEYVSEESLERVAELLGETGRDLEFANKDVKRLWLSVMKSLKQSAGKEQFKDLETLATVVGNSKTTPDHWEPK